MLSAAVVDNSVDVMRDATEETGERKEKRYSAQLSDSRTSSGMKGFLKGKYAIIYQMYALIGIL